MITLKPNRVDYRNHNTPILYDREIDEFAHAVLEDYKPQLLREPGIELSAFFRVISQRNPHIQRHIQRRPDKAHFRRDSFQRWYIKSI